MNYNINRINESDTIKAVAIDIHGYHVSNIYDSGFHSIEHVINELKRKASGWCRPISQVKIENLDKQTYGTYTSYGKKLW